MLTVGIGRRPRTAPVGDRSIIERLSSDEQRAAATVALGSILLVQIPRVVEALRQQREAVGSPGAISGTHLDVLENVAGEIMYWVERLLSLPCSSASIPHVALCARSLLELAVWAGWSAKSEENAKALRAEGDFDVRGFAEACSHLSRLASKKFPAEAAVPFASILHTLGNVAADVVAPGRKHVALKPLRAARDLGLEPAYLALNRVFSKYLHPSAMVILAPAPNEVTIALLHSIFQICGVFLAGTGLEYLLGPAKRAGLVAPLDAASIPIPKLKS